MAALLVAQHKRVFGQQIIALLNVPFTAIGVEETGGVQARSRVGRSGNGSWFSEKLDPEGRPEYRTIKDAERQELIVLNLKEQVYVVHHLPLPSVNFKTHTVAEWAVEEEGYRRQLEKDGRSLGTKTDAGLVVFGQTSTLGDQRTEKWDSVSLGVTTAYNVKVAGHERTKWWLADIETKEPERCLFIIPSTFRLITPKGRE